ncbi:MAG: hypothetical protein JWM85_3605 [Acidimicrobiaceae bacterium]|nr:hypothetical protein [Acidimicrobiaceae bacterium]
MFRDFWEATSAAMVDDWEANQELRFLVGTVTGVSYTLDTERIQGETRGDLLRLLVAHERIDAKTSDADYCDNRPESLYHVEAGIALAAMVAR